MNDIKTKSNTSIRNGDLFCFNCGRSQALPLPMNAGVVAQIMISFAKEHENCPKTWVEPSTDETKDMQALEDKKRWWLRNGERGASSESIYSVLSGDYIRAKDRLVSPSDCDDFKRCHLLLEAIPEFRPLMYKMKEVSPEWGRLVDNWDTLTGMLKEMMTTNVRNDMYQFMKTLINLK